MDSGRSAPSKHQAIPAAFPPNTAAELPTDGARVSRYKVGKDGAKGAHTTLLSHRRTTHPLTFRPGQQKEDWGSPWQEVKLLESCQVFSLEVLLCLPDWFCPD